MHPHFQDRTIIVTGAGKGLGRAYALYLAGLGAGVVVNNRRHAGESEGSADRVVNEIRAAGGRAVAEYSSVEDPAAGPNLLAAALDAFGRLDGVIANAGVSEGRTFRKQNLEDFRRVIDINLMGTVNILHPAFCHLYDQGHGSMVVSTSVAGLYGEHGLPAYSASKAALLGLMYALSKEGAPHRVRVNALAPYAATQMTEDALPPELHEPMRPERVAPVAAWLVSDDCPLNGETLICGAGKWARARVQETAPLSLAATLDYQPEVLLQSWHEAEQRPLDHSSTGAIDHFRRFVAGQPRGQR